MRSLRASGGDEAAELSAEERERNAERRGEERMVLEAIYGEDVVQPVEGEAELLDVLISLQLPAETVRLEVADALLAAFPSARARADEPSDDERARGVRAVALPGLPPLRLRLRLPAAYPSRAAPGFGLSCAWLSDAQLEALARRLDALWLEARAEAGGEGAEVVASWVAWLREDAVGSEALPRLEPVELPAAPPAAPPAATPAAPPAADAGGGGGRRGVRWPRAAEAALAALLAHAQRAEAEAWAAATHACGVCLEEKASVDCLRFVRCGHTFCRGCVGGFFASQLEEGALGGMLCPEPACRLAATPDEVRAALPAALWERFERLELQASLAQMRDVAWCPRCAYPALLDEEGGRLARCGACDFCFCTECQQTWHGVAPCANLAARWQAADEAGRAALRRKYGDALVEEVQSAAWVSEHTRPCPRCATPVEKNGGCNHITCKKCNHEWCWLCSSSYTPGHFRNGACEQFSQDFFDEINLSREQFEANYVVANHW